MKETQFIDDRHLRDKNVSRFDVLEKVKDLNELKPELEHELHNYHVEIKNLKKIIKNYF